MQADPNNRVFFEELKRLGYVEGENLIVERYSGLGRLERYKSLAHEVVDTKPDLICSVGAPLTLRFKAATSTIPIVAITGDPIRFGIISSIARPGGNITGVSTDAGVEIWGKRLAILAEAVPKLVNVVYISTQRNWNSAGGRATQEAAQKLGISLVNALLGSTEPKRSTGAYLIPFNGIKSMELFFRPSSSTTPIGFCWLNWSSKSAFPQFITHLIKWRPGG